MDAHTNGHSATDEAIDLLYSWMPPLGAPQPCPEAAFSLTLKGTLDGVEALFTVRGQTASEFKANLAAVRGLLDQPQASREPQSGPTPPAPEKRYCPVHGTELRWNEGRDGKKGWFSHKTPDGWCRGN